MMNDVQDWGAAGRQHEERLRKQNKEYLDAIQAQMQEQRQRRRGANRRFEPETLPPQQQQRFLGVDPALPSAPVPQKPQSARLPVVSSAAPFAPPLRQGPVGAPAAGAPSLLPHQLVQPPPQFVPQPFTDADGRRAPPPPGPRAPPVPPIFRGGEFRAGLGLANPNPNPPTN